MTTPTSISEEAKRAAGEIWILNRSSFLHWEIEAHRFIQSAIDTATAELRAQLAEATRQRDEIHKIADEYRAIAYEAVPLMDGMQGGLMRVRHALRELVELRAQLATVERERDEARHNVYRAGDSPIAALGVASENEQQLRANLSTLRAHNEKLRDALEGMVENWQSPNQEVGQFGAGESPLQIAEAALSTDHGADIGADKAPKQTL